MNQNTPLGNHPYFVQLALTAYTSGIRPDTRFARALLAKIKEELVTDGFKPLDVYL